MASGKPPEKSPDRARGQLGRTIMDLEAALADWDSLTDETAPAAAAPQPAPQDELRKKTKKLLDQLKEQLAELDD